jgi:hypothetical protein
MGMSESEAATTRRRCAQSVIRWWWTWPASRIWRLAGVVPAWFGTGSWHLWFDKIKLYHASPPNELEAPPSSPLRGRARHPLSLLRLSFTVRRAQGPLLASPAVPLLTSYAFFCYAFDSFEWSELTVTVRWSAWFLGRRQDMREGEKGWSDWFRLIQFELYFAIRLSWLGVILCHSYTALYWLFAILCHWVWFSAILIPWIQLVSIDSLSLSNNSFAILCCTDSYTVQLRPSYLGSSMLLWCSTTYHSSLFYNFLK